MNHGSPEPATLNLRGAVISLLLMVVAIGTTRFFLAGTLVQFATAVAAPPIAMILLAIWLFRLNNLSHRDRFGLSATIVLTLVVGSFVVHRSMSTLGMLTIGMPLVLIAFVSWLLLVRGRMFGWRRKGTYVAIVAPMLLVSNLRLDGLDGRFTPSFGYRWAASAEDRYLESVQPDFRSVEEPTGFSQPTIAGPDDWLGFRGTLRDGVARNFTLEKDWAEAEFVELWRRPIGPAWSSFAVVGNRVFTQEQRGELETVLCLDADTGRQVWAYSYPGRFYEVVGNAGPRATPTFDSGRIFTLGARGTVTALDASTGSQIWQSDMVADSGAKTPQWGFSSSPLIVNNDTVILLAGAPGTKVIAYNAVDGSVKWQSLDGATTYSSPQFMILDSVPQVVVMDGDGAYGLEPTSGELLWRNDWPLLASPRIIQPLQVDGRTVLIGTGYGEGTRKLEIYRTGSEWSVKELWTSRSIKPYFNDYVMHKGYLYGFDHEIITCIDIETGQRMWKRGRYGFGQMLLVPDDDILVVLGEWGELALLRATPDKADSGEIQSLQVLDGKTWNHPVLVRDRLYIRNSEQAVCYQLNSSR